MCLAVAMPHLRQRVYEIWGSSSVAWANRGYCRRGGLNDIGGALHGPENNVDLSLGARLTFYAACTTSSLLMAHIHPVTALMVFPGMLF